LADVAAAAAAAGVQRSSHSFGEVADMVSVGGGGVVSFVQRAKNSDAIPSVFGIVKEMRGEPSPSHIHEQRTEPLLLR
jgi:hypothetical protein